MCASSRPEKSACGGAAALGFPNLAHDGTATVPACRGNAAAHPGSRESLARCSRYRGPFARLSLVVWLHRTQIIWLRLREELDKAKVRDSHDTDSERCGTKLRLVRFEGASEWRVRTRPIILRVRDSRPGLHSETHPRRSCFCIPNPSSGTPSWGCRPSFSPHSPRSA